MDIERFTKPGEHPLSETIREIIYLKWRNAPRSLQVGLGPSEIGEPCARKLAQKIMHEPKTNEGDPLPSVMGTAGHSWMEDALDLFNSHLGYQRFIPEGEVEIAPGVHPGHSDCFDTLTGTVIDWKFPGATKMKMVKEQGPGDQYRYQAHLYGKGFKAQGYDVKEVLIAFIPRGGNLSDMHVWSEPFDESVADEALARYYRLVEVCVKLDVENHPERYVLIPKNASHACTFCDFFRPISPGGVDTGKGCPGWTNEKDQQPPQS